MHKLFTYTDESQLKVTPNEILVNVFAKVAIDDDLATEMSLNVGAVTTSPIMIETRFPLKFGQEEKSTVLACAEAVAQIAAVGPDFFNIFGIKKGINNTRLMLVSSQPVHIDFFNREGSGTSDAYNAYGSIHGTFFYGTVGRGMKEGECDWAKPLLTGEQAPAAIYNASFRNVFERLLTKNSIGEFMLTRKSIEDFLSLPQRYKEHQGITRPFQATRAVFEQFFEEAQEGTGLAPKQPFDADGNRIRHFLSKRHPSFKNNFRVKLKVLEGMFFNKPVYIVTNIDMFVTYDELIAYTEQGITHGKYQAEVREKYKELQRQCLAGELG
ncbi:hypothetical protein HUO09_16985 [Vibrio sp. Y2-5]|uniref:hypothetical protein n=1 Tax=Vibrio sp. Y2-5 TaxID=2743977 RepID=UPI001661787B|nr:hypothetical protein [Vibrio sp. Y2-5]MBD0788051.1 hypothetical protein [Vibrio sp. Y2-5]